MSAVLHPQHQELSLPPVADAAAAYRAAWQRGWQIPAMLPVREWSERFRVLPREGASEPGPYRTSRTPYVREIMACLDYDHPARRVAFMSSTQVAKTETGNNWMASIIHQRPGPVMVLMPTQNLAKRWSKQRFKPMVEATAVLQPLIKPARSRDSGNTTLMKEFPGGFLVIAGANSAADLSSMPVRDLYCDEIDRYPDDVDGEGAPLKLAERRQSTFPRRKTFITSSPTLLDASPIYTEFKRGDQRIYYVPCPHCQAKQELRDENLQEDGAYLCEACGESIEHRHKTWMLEHGEWRAMNPDGAFPSFHISALYAAIGLGYTWADIAEMRREAHSSGDPKLLQTYYNTILGLPYEDDSGKVDWKEVAERRGGYQSRTIPRGCLILTAGVDTQDDRFHVNIWGWGRNSRRWLIDRFEVPADPALEEHWEKLDELVLNVAFRNQYGIDMRVTTMAVDTGGHHTHMAYNYCRLRRHRRVLAIKGDRYKAKPVLAGRPSKLDVNTRGGVLKGGVELWRVGTDTAKGYLFAQLNADSANDQREDDRVRFPSDVGDDFFMQLTAERYDAVNDRWRKLSGRRNEDLDCTVYAHAAAYHPAVRVHRLTERDWQALEETFEPMVQDLFSAAPEEQPSGDSGQQESQNSQPAPKPEPRPRPPQPAARRGRRVRSKGVR